MLIQPAEPAHDNQRQRHPSPGARADSGLDLLPAGVFRARIDALLDNGQVRIHVAGRSYQFTPQEPLLPGDTVALRVVARTPHLILQLADHAGDAAPDLSRTATLIARLAAQGAPRAGLVVAAQPAMAAPPADTADLAAQLSQMIARSGLFYESHQAEWHAGLRSLALLGTEPQSRLRSPPPDADGIAAPAGDPSPRQAVTARQLQVHPDALPLIQAQLDTLDSRSLQWRGELWPGLRAEWEISDGHDAPKQSAPAESPAQTWQTRLHLILPHLGPVSAVLQVRPSGAAIRIAAASAGSAATLDADAGRLRAALAAAGITVNTIAIEAIASGETP